MVITDYLPIMTERIRKEFDPLKIVLFGSLARGEVDPDSDIDLLVVLPHVEDKRSTSVAIRQALGDLPVPKDIVVTSPSEIRQRKDFVGDILSSALAEGKTIYERP